ncbi:MAG: 4-hydroxyphenylacetate 3-hydroxylase N-terminal domain-containing protein, partial [Pseudomonadota bacterium]
TFEIDSSGRRSSMAWFMPKTYEEMVQRRKALSTLAETHGGFFGRSPDHVASALAGQMMGIDQFESYSEYYARNFRDYFHYARENDLFLSYVIIDPQVNRSKTVSDIESDAIMRVVDEDDTGITVRGAKMMGTSTVMSNEIFVAHLQPLRPGDEKYAVSFAIPLETKGVRIISRKSFEASAVSEFDNPFSSRFDENDAVLFFDDVKVPKDRIFVNQNVEMSNRQFHGTPGHISQNYQSMIRLSAKLKFLLGVAHKITETIGTNSMPPVQGTLGKLASDAAMLEGMVHGMEAKGTHYGDYYVPNKHFLYATQVFSQELYPNFVQSVRELAGGSVIMLPSSAADFGNADLSEVINLVQVSEAMTPTERVKFLKLAWDVTGSEFASRHQQYEMFYAGAQFVTRGHSFRTYDWGSSTNLVDGFLAEYDLPVTKSETRLRSAS